MHLCQTALVDGFCLNAFAGLVHMRFIVKEAFDPLPLLFSPREIWHVPIEMPEGSQGKDVSADFHIPHSDCVASFCLSCIVKERFLSESFREIGSEETGDCHVVREKSYFQMSASLSFLESLFRAAVPAEPSVDSGQLQIRLVCLKHGITDLVDGF
jgi:hypothetical protein